MNKISAVVLTKNVEDKIEKCLKNLDFVDEIIVIDNSEDKTPEIAKKFSKTKVYSRLLDNFSAQRNFGIEKASSEWILMVDSDEEVESGFASLVEQAIEKDEASAYKFPRKNIVFGKWIEHAGWYPDYQTRLFKKGKAHYQRLVHEKLEVEGETKELDVHIIHYNYETVYQFLDKLQKYTTLEADELFSTGYKFHWPDMIIKSNAEFLRRLFAEEGYKDGLHGLVLSILQAFYTFAIYLKIWEKEKFKEEKDILVITEKSFEKVTHEWSFWFFKTIPHNIFSKIWKKLR
jgi:glycosyltransferase involved in cell wall biosynthesis